MDGWDWLHAGLQVATYAKAHQAQQNLSEMKTAVEIEAARRILLEAMKSFIFEISRDIQLAEEQLTAFPQQVYIVSKSLDWRLINSGLSAEIFPDFQDKEYVFKTQKKIAEVVGKSKAGLTQQQIQQSETAVQYLSELPMLQQAITAKFAQESLMATDEQWRKLSRSRSNKKQNLVVGAIGLIPGLCVAGIGLMLLWDSMTSKYHHEGYGTQSLIVLAVGGAVLFFSIAGLVGNKPLPEYETLKTNRESWEKQLMPQKDWQQVVSTFGDLTSGQFQKIYQERLTFLHPVLGGDFQKYLSS
jgi:hypothetical protein